MARFLTAIEHRLVDRLRILGIPGLLFSSYQVKTLWLVGGDGQLIPFTDSIRLGATTPAGALVERGWHLFGPPFDVPQADVESDHRLIGRLLFAQPVHFLLEVVGRAGILHRDGRGRGQRKFHPLWNVNFASAAVHCQPGFDDNFQVWTIRVWPHLQSADNTPTVQGNVMEPKFVRRVFLLGGKVPLGQELAREVIVPAQRRDITRQTVVGRCVVMVSLHRWRLHESWVERPTRGCGAMPFWRSCNSSFEQPRIESYPSVAS